MAKDKNTEVKNETTGQDKKPKNKSKLYIIILSVVAVIAVACSSVFGALYHASVYVIGPIKKSTFLAKAENNINMPIIEINTQGKKHPKNKVDYINCSFEISNCEDTSYNFSVAMAKEFDNKEDGVESVGIRLRGNSTMLNDKKPYRIKFEEKKSLLGLKDNKNWVLLADYMDQSSVRNYAAHTLAGYFDGLDFAVTPNHVALIINGEFMGLYLLCEQIDENKGRVNVKDNDVVEDEASIAQGAYSSDITNFPFLIEMNKLDESIAGDVAVQDLIVVEGLEELEIKYPECDERIIQADGTDVIYDYIKGYMTAVVDAFKNGSTTYRGATATLADLVDIDSFIDFWLVNEIMMNTDSVKKSVYLSKTTDGKLKFGPVWDFDWSMSRAWYEKTTYDKSEIETAQTLCCANGSMLFKTFLQNEDNYNRVAARYDEVKGYILDVAEQLRTYKQTIQTVAEIDAEMWYGKTGKFEFGMQFDYVRLYLIDRYAALDKIFDKSHADFLQII